MPAGLLHNTLKMDTSWEVSKYGPEITPYFDTFHAVEVLTCSYFNVHTYHEINYNVAKILLQLNPRKLHD